MSNNDSGFCDKIETAIQETLENPQVTLDSNNMTQEQQRLLFTYQVAYAGLETLCTRRFWHDWLFFGIGAFPLVILFLFAAKHTPYQNPFFVLPWIGSLAFCAYWWEQTTQNSTRQNQCRRYLKQLEEKLPLRIQTTLAAVSKAVGRDVEDVYFPRALSGGLAAVYTALFASLIF